MIDIKQIKENIDYIDFFGDSKLEINKVVPITEVNGIEKAISWCSDKNESILKNIDTNSLIIVSETNNYKDGLNNYIIVENPRRTFQKILAKFFEKSRNPSISSSATIAKNSKIGENIFIGHNVIIEEDCIIGSNTTILHNTNILRGTLIGSNVNIGCNSTIGGIGFGYEKNNKGDFELIPHIGNVVIKNSVDIGNNTCIDRAVLGSTIVEDNVKIDNLVHIAHGVKVGRNSVVIANAMIAGSVNIGENSWIAPSSSVLNKKSIGNNALVGMGAVVTKDVKDSTIVAGNPSKFLRNIEG